MLFRSPRLPGAGRRIRIPKCKKIESSAAILNQASSLFRRFEDLIFVSRSCDFLEEGFHREEMKAEINFKGFDHEGVI